VSAELARFLDDCRDALARGVFAKLTLAAPTGAHPAKNVVARPVTLKAGERLQLVFRQPGHDVTRNLEPEAAWAELAALVPASFGHAHLHTTEKTVQLERRGERFLLREGPPAHDKPAPTAHDRAKKRVLDPDPRWLAALGVTGKRGPQDKLRQVQRFVEVLDHWLGDVPRPEDGRVRWVDVGSGGGALTFATWEYLRRTGFRAAEVVGVERRPELAAKTERVARELGCDGLSFVAGDVADRELGAVDGILALHACDTATDDALALAVQAGARWVMVAPQLAPAPLAGALKHGILRTREAEIATDALRAALLESAGYDARVFEFVSTEHTDKNLMITGVKVREPDPGAVEARSLASFYGVTHQRLADRLGIGLGPDR
jgi:hypothetical protein